MHVLVVVESLQVVCMMSISRAAPRGTRAYRILKILACRYYASCVRRDTNQNLLGVTYFAAIALTTQRMARPFTCATSLRGVSVARRMSAGQVTGKANADSARMVARNTEVGSDDDGTDRRRIRGYAGMLGER